MCNRVPDEIEEGGEEGIAGSFGCLLCPVRDLGEKRKDLIGGYRVDISFTEFLTKSTDDKAIVSAVFFLEFAS